MAACRARGAGAGPAEPGGGVGDADLDLAVEPAGAAQRGVDGLVAVRRPDDDDLTAAAEAVHEGEELGDDAALHLAGDLLALRRDAVQLVDEEDARGVLLGLLELLPQAFLGLPVVLRHDL